MHDAIEAPAPCDRCEALEYHLGHAGCGRASQDSQGFVSCRTALSRYRSGKEPCGKFRPGSIQFVDLALKGIDVVLPPRLPERLAVPLPPEKILWLLQGGSVEVELRRDGISVTTLILSNAAGGNLPRIRG